MTRNQPATLTEKWLTARLGTGGGYRADEVIAHAKRDGHGEADIRAAFRKLEFVEFPEPGTKAPVWSSFVKCMAQREDGNIVWANGTVTGPRGQLISGPTVAVQPVAQPKTSAPAAPAPVPVHAAKWSVTTPTMKTYTCSELRSRIAQIAQSDESWGREALALVLVQGDLTTGEALAVLRTAAKDTSGEPQIDTAGIYAARAKSMGHGEETPEAVGKRIAGMVNKPGARTATEIYRDRAAARSQQR